MAIKWWGGSLYGHDTKNENLTMYVNSEAFKDQVAAQSSVAEKRLQSVGFFCFVLLGVIVRPLGNKDPGVAARGAWAQVG